MFPILAIDQGTTSTKAYRLDEAGNTVVIGNRTHRQIRPHAGWVEHDPVELLENVQALLKDAGSVGTVGLANQGETVVAWDARTKCPLANAIVWQDDRTSAVTERLKAEGAEAVTLARGGLPLDPYFSATKLRWLLDNAEGARELQLQGRLRLGTSDAYFIDALTGEFATDVSTASRTSLMDLRALRWMKRFASCLACRATACRKFARRLAILATCQAAPGLWRVRWISRPRCSGMDAMGRVILK